jgi:enoyl-CoA hydratase/carnithine racemase
MSYEAITYETDGRVAVISFNRPKQHNAFNAPLREEIPRAVRRADEDQEIRVVVIAGAGGKAFSTGYDLKELPETQPPIGELRDRMASDLEYTYCVWRCSKPVIAMIDGWCLGGALEFAQMCDVRYCSDDSQFAVIETRFSFGIATLIMPWIMGARSRELIYTGDTFGAEEALRLGLVNRVFPKANLRTETVKIAKRMSQVALACLQWNKRAINQTYETMGIGPAMRYGVEACSILDSTETPEYRHFEALRRKEGLAAALKWRDSLFAQFE